MSPYAVLQVLREDHARLKEIVSRMEALLGAPGLGSDPGLHRQLDTMLRFLQKYSDRLHHPVENCLFDRLIEKGLTPTERRVVFLIMAQHEEVLGEARNLQDALRPPEADRLPGAVLKTQAERFLNTQRHHIEFEDTQLLPLIDIQLTAKDWRDLDDELGSIMASLRGGCEQELLAEYRSLVGAA